MRITQVFALFATIALPAFAETKFALIVAIDEYAERKGLPCKTDNRGFLVEEEGGSKSGPLCPARGVPALKNAVNDGNNFQEILKARYQFSTGEVRYLKNKDARASEILLELKGSIKRLREGDRLVFYFAGHGTRLRNRKGDFQEALVPYDYELGALPILDVELVPIYREAVRKRIQMTAILDSCHSGGMARGFRTRNVDDGRIVSVPVDPVPSSGSLAILAAARGQETATDNPQTFTMALTSTIRNNTADLSLTELAGMIPALLTNNQSPAALGGNPDQVNVAGQRAQALPLSYRIVQVTMDGKIVLDRGIVNGITPGSLFSLDGKPDMKYEVERVELAKAYLTRRPGTSLPKAGDLLKLVRRKMPETSRMKVYVPAKLPEARDISRLKECLSQTEPLLPTSPRLHEVRWSANGWVLAAPGEKEQPLRCEALRALGGNSVLVSIPPTREVRATLEKELGADQDMLGEFLEAPYEVVGRLREGRLEYALARRLPSESDLLVPLTKWNQDWVVRPSVDPPLAPYPESGPVQDCVPEAPACAEILGRRIQRARVLAALSEAESFAKHLVTSPGVVEARPWRIEVREKDGKACSTRTVSEIRRNEKYCLMLIYQGSAANQEGWYLSLWGIDSAGLMENLTPPDKTVSGSREIKVVSEYRSIPSEGDREALFLFASKEPLKSDLIDTSFQKEPVMAKGRDGGPPAQSGHWSIVTTLIKVK